MSSAANPSRVPINRAGTEALGARAKFARPAHRGLYDRRGWTHHLLQRGGGRAMGGAPGAWQKRILRLVETLLA